MAVEMNDTLIFNSVTNYTAYINQTSTFSVLNVTDDGFIQFYQFSGNIKNTNNTYISRIDLYQMINYLIYNTNGSIYGSSIISNNDGNINITLPPNNASYVLDNYNLTEGVNRQNSPIWMSTSTSKTAKTWSIRSNITDSITILSYFNVDCSRVGTVTVTPKNGNAYTPTYTCGSDDILRITNLNINYSQNSNTVTANYDSYKTNFFSTVTAGVPSFFSGFAVVFVLLAIIIVVGVIMIAVKIINGDDINMIYLEEIFEIVPLKVIFYSILVITMLAWVFIVLMGVLSTT